MTLKEKDLLLVNNNLNTNHQHEVAGKRKSVLLDYSADNFSIKYEMTFMPFHSWGQTSPTIHGQEGWIHWTELKRNQNLAQSWEGKPAKGQKCSLGWLEGRRFSVKAWCWHNSTQQEATINNSRLEGLWKFTAFGIALRGEQQEQ